MLVKGAAEIIGDIILAVGESACTAESAHDGAAFAVDAGVDLLPVNGTAALFQRMPRFKYGDAAAWVFLFQFIGGKNAARAGAHDYGVEMFHVQINPFGSQHGGSAKAFVFAACGTVRPHVTAIANTTILYHFSPAFSRAKSLKAQKPVKKAGRKNRLFQCGADFFRQR